MVILRIFIKIKVIQFKPGDLMNLTELLGPIENKDPQNSCSRTAMIWGPDDLLTQAMEFFLKEEETWQVVRIFAGQSTEELFDKIESIHPDVIILHIGNCADNARLPFQLLQDYPNLRVITTSLENNQMDVYSKQSFRLRKASDLLSIVEDSHFSDHPAEKEVKKSEQPD
jgi:hypothetical protein